jgi:hypothetical protein
VSREVPAARLAPILVGGIALAVYLRTLAPTVTLVDSGELIVAARNLGVAHPPGFPLYVLMAHAATWAPFGSVAQRVNAASAVFAALAAAVTSLALRELLLGLPLPSSRQEKHRGRKAARAEAPGPLQAGAAVLAATGLLFAFSRTLWAYATVAEVYTLNTLLVASALALVLRWRRSGQPRRALLAAAAAFGLGLGVHHVTVALTLPALAVLILTSRPRPSVRSLVVPALLVLLIPVLLYATLPLLAARHPVLSWGDPTSLERLFWHVSGRQYSAFLSIRGESVARELAVSLRRIAGEFGRVPVVPALGLLGFAALWRRDRPAFAFLAVLVTANLAFTSLYSIAEDKDAYELPALLGIALAAGVGAEALRARFGPRLPAAAGALVAALPLVPLASSFQARDRSRFLVAADYVDNVLRATAPEGLFLTSDWQIYSPLLYAQEVEGRRRDVVAVDVSLLRRSWYLEFLERRYPDLLGRVRPQVSEFLEDLRGWEKDPLSYDRDPELNRRINARFQGMMTGLVAARLEDAPAYATYDVVIPKASPDPALARLLFDAWTLRPRGIVFELVREKGFPPLAPLDLETRGLAKGPVEVDDVVGTKVRPAYLVMLVNRGRYLAAAKDAEGAREAFERALGLDPGLGEARQALDQLRLLATKTRSRE